MAQCVLCHKSFYNKKTLNSHVKSIHGNGGKKGARGETLFINSSSQDEITEFDTPSQSSVVCEEGVSPDLFSDSPGVDVVSHTESAGNDDNDDSGSEFLDRSDEEPYDFCRLDIWGIINKWFSGKTGKQKMKYILNRIFKLTLLSRALYRDEILASIMLTAGYFEVTFHMGFDEALEHAVLKRRFLIRDILVLSTKENSRGNSDTSMSDDESTVSEFDIWKIVNDILNVENISGDARTNRGVELVLCFMQRGVAWRRDTIYRAIMTILKKARVDKHMTFQKALTYAIDQNRYKIRKKLIERDDGSESDDSDETKYDSDEN